MQSPTDFRHGCKHAERLAADSEIRLLPKMVDFARWTHFCFAPGILPGPDFSLMLV
jgi:hypothetical protein